MLPSREKQEDLKKTLLALDIKQKDLYESFISGGGKGGQKINKTQSCVYLKHLPTGIEVKCQKERSRELNRFLAKRLLCEKLKEKNNIPSTKQLSIAKLRKQKANRKQKATKKYND